MKGKRLYLLNRAPYSSHVKLLKNQGFEIVCDVKFENRSGITRKDLADEFKNMSEEDLYTSGAILQAVKK
jgi:argonaute-like protein implicated in RNA metabolism and viral defense